MQAQAMEGTGSFLGLAPGALLNLGIGIMAASVAVLLVLAFLWGRVGRPRTELMIPTAVALLLLLSGIYLNARGASAHADMMASMQGMMGSGMAMGGGTGMGGAGMGGTGMGGNMDMGGGAMPMDSAAAATAGISAAPLPAASSEALALLSDRELYEVFCFSCHGLTGTGNGPVAAYLAVRPANIAEHLTHHPEPDLIRILIEGFPPVMPASPIGEAEAARILRYLRTVHPPTEVMNH